MTEFGKKVKAPVLLSYGNASQPGNKHVGDQLELLSEKKNVLQHLEKRELLDAGTSNPKTDQKSIDRFLCEWKVVNSELATAILILIKQKLY